MRTLQIALNDGFQGQHVTISVNGKRVYDRNGVTTDLRIARADAVDVNVSGTEANIVVAVEPGSGPQSIVLDLAVTPFLAIDLQADGQLRWRPTSEPLPIL